jgi:hypothetical protein
MRAKAPPVSHGREQDELTAASMVLPPHRSPQERRA